jgi:hypothetical protein
MIYIKNYPRTWEDFSDEDKVFCRICGLMRSAYVNKYNTSSCGGGLLVEFKNNQFVIGYKSQWGRKTTIEEIINQND